MKKQSSIAQIAIFFAIMLVLHLLSSVIFNLLPVPIKPTIIHIPVIIASIIYGPRIGAVLGALMGVISVVTNTVVLLPTSYLFSPFVENGSINSLIIAMVPRILIGITPYFVYKWMKNKPGLVLAGAVGSMTNTIFVLGGIFILFSSVYNGDIRAMLALVLSANSISEMIISALLTVAIVPALEKLKK
ncbi:Pantothenic acid transporter PanT [Streptococcus cristatus]|uniref:Pantothenic acid transporter PanT n=1 Tax=Streptococcus cristatus TaxID=45634 RepID=A0A3R9MNI0_STRCR|nr:ECF transporter S component [Streptococcus cristatus]RSJ77282.1 Pantothenic acid transporter PanT [Streptococcus cristatus]RSJ79384.1 Pantothenic acid transporter PanT [Streptococcus cristatus]RSJ85178.1 Pantothenic acid transporter PanT [Streptococcus cristatus]RSJ85276.1 Pantothenic acid transporter PanT [Streptococcus cristatus]